MNRKTITATIFLALAVSVQATTITLTSGVTTPNSHATTISFAGLDHNTPSPFIFEDETIGSWNRGNAPFFTGSTPNSNANPTGISDSYMAVGGAGVPELITLTFDSPLRYLGFLFGTADQYNHLLLFNDDDLVSDYTGEQLIPPGNGTVGDQAYVNMYFSRNAKVDKVEFLSGVAAMEVANISFQERCERGNVVPEPTTFGFIGVGLIGLTWLKRKK